MSLNKRQLNIDTKNANANKHKPLVKDFISTMGQESVHPDTPNGIMETPLGEDGQIMELDDAEIAYYRSLGYTIEETQ